MKKFIILFVLFSVCLSSCNDNYLKKSIDKNKLSVVPFSNDNQRFGLVDLKGNIIVDNEWESPSSIASEGIVRVKNKDGYYEFYTADKNPKKIGAEYKDAALFSEGLAAVVNEKGFIHYIDKAGNIKFELPDDGKGSPVQKAGIFSEGLARFQNSEKLWGFINQEGKVVIKPRYDFVRNFKEGVAMVERYNVTTSETSIGFINIEDIEVIPISERYTALGNFQEGLAACTDKDGKNQWGYINKSGDKAIEISKIRVKVMPFQKDGHAAFFDGSYWGLIDKTGEIVVNPRFDDLLAYYCNGLGPYTNSSNEIGFINSDRQEIIKCQYEEVLPFFANTTVVKDKYYIFINKEGKPASEKNTYLKYVPIDVIMEQYLTFSDQLVKSLYLNTASIVNAIIRDISSSSVNELTFNSTIRDVINYLKIPKSKLPKNSYQKYIIEKIDLAGNLEPYKLKIIFNEPVLTQEIDSRNLKINDRAKIKIIEYNIYTRGLDKEQFKGVVDNLVMKIEKAGFEKDMKATESSWKENATVYRQDQTFIEISYSSSAINLKIDYSEYF